MSQRSARGPTRSFASDETVANEHFDQVAPPPMESARRLHERLLRERGNNGH